MIMNKRAIMAIPLEALTAMLEREFGGLPSLNRNSSGDILTNSEIYNLVYDPERMTLYIHYTHPDLQEIPEGGQTPIGSCSYAQHTI